MSAEQKHFSQDKPPQSFSRDLPPDPGRIFTPEQQSYLINDVFVDALEPLRLFSQLLRDSQFMVDLVPVTELWQLGDLLLCLEDTTMERLRTMVCKEVAP